MKETQMQPVWLCNLAAKPISDAVWEIDIKGYGPADVGPYQRLVRYRGAREGLDAHHIVGVEHLRMVRTAYGEADAPAVLIPTCLHRQVINSCITGGQEQLGGRPRDGKARAGRHEILALYRQLYTWHTNFEELFAIAESVLNSRR
jgi:hypothetical protein